MIAEARFSTELMQIEEVPEPLKTELRRAMKPRENFGLILYKPAETEGGEVSPPKVLAVTDDSLVFVEKSTEGPAHAMRCRFEDVTLVELSTLLLYGHLKIHFVQNNASNSLAMGHNLVAEDLYRHAATLILDRISDRYSSITSSNATSSTLMDKWPTPIRNAASASILSPNRPDSAAWWPTIHGGFGYELGPMGAVLAVNDRILIVQVEEAGPWNRVREQPTYGTIATYIPTNRLVQVHREPNSKFCIFELEMHARHGGERFSFMVPPDHRAAVGATLDAALAKPRAKSEM
jgi:hypothetical protein